MSTGAATRKSMLAADTTDTTESVRRARRHGLRRRFQPGAGSPARRQQHWPEPAHQRRHRRDHHRWGAQFGGATRAGVTSAAYTNSFASACRTTLFYIDTATDRLLATTDPNSGVRHRGRRARRQRRCRRRIRDRHGCRRLEFRRLPCSPSAARRRSTRSISTTGAATATGALTGLNSGETSAWHREPRRRSTAPTQAVGELLGVSEANQLVSFNSGAPQKLCTSATISGLQAGENVARHRRASGGRRAVRARQHRPHLHGRCDHRGCDAQVDARGGRCRHDESVHGARRHATFGVDFNPVPDRLRVVSNTGQNLRINVDTGATTTDTDAESRPARRSRRPRTPTASRAPARRRCMCSTSRTIG